MRPGCDRPAAARVAFDPVALQLWLDPLSRHAAPVQELCEFHIERLTIPRGWTATDRRPAVGVEAVVAAPEPPASAATEPAPEREAELATVPPVPAPPPASDPPPADARPGRPRQRRRERTGDDQSLLSRAFALSGPQESVLTTGRSEPGTAGDSSD